jgi:KamA family protein
MTFDRRSRYRPLTIRDLPELAARYGFTDDQVLHMRAVAEVLPFRTNSYVVEELIDWSAVPDDPIFRLTFPQAGMLPSPALAEVVRLLGTQAPRTEIERSVRDIRAGFNPHPDDQLELNVPTLDGRPLPGLQHKYPETVLFFPSAGQTCHAYCTFCFRWPQFIGEPGMRISASGVGDLIGYLQTQPQISDVLITGGDASSMSAAVLARYIEPLLAIESVTTIRLGTKSLAFWPYRFTHDRDADDLLRLFERVVRSGRHLAVMAHFSHPRELSTQAARDAIARVRATGATIRAQAPLIRGINDSAECWARLWADSVRLGIMPYYFFIERDTGAQHYFAVPLARAFEIFRDASAQVSGLARTARGPVMSASPGKVTIDGIVEIAGEKVFALRFLQARRPDWVGRPFFAAFDPEATWFTDLKPALGATALQPGA